MKRWLLFCVLLMTAATCTPGNVADPQQTAGKTVQAQAIKPGPLVDINRAAKEELERLPGIGPAYAERIIRGRPYSRKDQLVSRDILPKAVYNKIKDLIIAKQER